MEVDWLTVAAQTINFLILVGLLKRFLYQPIIQAMDERELRIAARLHDADLREQTAIGTTQEYQRKIATWESSRVALLQEATTAAEATRRELLDEARNEVAKQRSHWQLQVTQERNNFLHSLKQQAAESIQGIARRSLSDLANVDLEHQIVESFLHRLKSLPPDNLHTINSTNEAIQITTSFALDGTVRNRVTRALHENIGRDVNIVYKESPELLCGIELTVAGQRISWTLAEYLDELDQRVQAQLETISGAG